jgi:uncharacterized membrane protein (UPF0127 family)
MRPVRRQVLALLLLAAAAVLAQPARAFESGTLAIRSHDGTVHNFLIELARTPDERAQGLMFRKEMDPQAGMLFDFGEEQPIAMWMKNTFIPLDMLFIDPQGRIINIAERTVPHSLDPVAAAAPARAVLELNGGTASRLGIRPGDRVVFPIFGTAS